LARVATRRASAHDSSAAKFAIISRPRHQRDHGGIEKTASSTSSAATASTSRRARASMYATHKHSVELDTLDPLAL
jgi:hypothetical protein